MQGCKSIMGTMHVLGKFTIWILGESMGNGELLQSQLCRRNSGVRRGMHRGCIWWQQGVGVIVYM